MSMFKSAQNLRNVVTLFHDPKISSSVNLLKYIRSHYDDRSKVGFDVDVVDRKPTKEQLQTLIELAPKWAPDFEHHGIKRPTLVDWFHGKVAVDNESAAKAILKELAEANEKKSA